MARRCRGWWQGGCPLLALVVASSGACSQRAGEVSLRPPPRVEAALSQLDELAATAQLFPDQGSAQDPVDLERGRDGVSFSGFLPAEPGAYTLEVVFSGRLPETSAFMFLGRWISDSFTVSRGDVVTPTFSRPLDTVGRPGDGGDADGDGLGNLDEILWGCDLERADSDGDGLSDGADCFPASAAVAEPIAEGGSIEDCDADGFRRPDLPSGLAGDDCDDLAPDVNPSAPDDCSDGIDQDCNPSTCPGSDTVGPQIVLIDPAAGETVGCGHTVRVELSDGSGVASGEVRLVDTSDPPRIEDSFPLHSIGGAIWESASFGDATQVFLADGVQRMVIYALDEAGNSAELATSVTFALAPPVLTFSASWLETTSAPVELTVTAAATGGLASLRLMRVPWVVDDMADRALETEVATATVSPALFSLDPSGLAAGMYLLYPLAEDAVGNPLQPPDSFSVDLTAAGPLPVEPVVMCTWDAGGVVVPLALLSVGDWAEPPATMRDHFDQALAEAAAVDAAAELVQIRGWGLEPDGTIGLDQIIGGEGKWWRYTFFNFADDREIEVTWYAAAEGIPNPEVAVEENSAFGFSYKPMIDPARLVDSDAAAAAYAAASSCPALTGAEEDTIRYQSDEPFNSFDTFWIEVGSSGWKATAAEPITEIFACE